MSMDELNLTDRATQILNDANRIATEQSHSSIMPLHLLAAMAEKPEGSNESSYLQTVVEKAHYDYPQFNRVINRHLVRLPSQTPAPPYVSLDTSTAKLINTAKKIRKSQKDEFLAQDHLLLALIKDTSIQPLLKECSMKPEALENAIQGIRGNTRIDSRSADTSSNFEFLGKYAIDLTEKARKGELDPVIGRDVEIRRCLHVLARRTKSNPCLIGDPGVGKTSVVEGVAQRIIDNDVPTVLQNCRLFALDVGALKAGAKYQGEFEERLKGVLKEIEESDQMIILFIDEIHMLMGDGKTDAANLLKPMLARGQLHCIGATTITEYRKYVEKDGAFERRFQKIDVKEPTIQETVAILRGLQNKYEIHHGVRILDSALFTAAQLASRYLTYRKLPDSAVDLIDEAAAAVAVTRDSKPEELDNMERQLQLVQVEIRALERDADTDAHTKEKLQQARQKEASILEKLKPLREAFQEERAGHEELNQLKRKLEDLKVKMQDAERRNDIGTASDLKYFAIPDIQKKISELEMAEKDDSLTHNVVDSEIIADTAARLTGIPVSKLTQTENAKLINMERELSKQVVGQPEAIKAVSNAVRLSRANLANPNAPPSFLFLGLSGSGKTELAKKLAGFLFNDEKAITRIDCSELSEKHSGSKLIGAPPGYVGYEEGGILTEALIRKPYSVVLFDEVEKASPDVLTILLQVLDDGRITSSAGKVVNCANCLIIMTSNLGAEYINRSTSSHIDDVTKELVMSAVKAHFKPEFLNRISSMVVFNRLSKKAIKKIVDIRLREINERLSANNKKIKVEVNEEAIEYLCKHGYSKDLGARPLNRLIQNTILNKLAVLLLRNQVRDGETARVVLNAAGEIEVLPNHEPDTTEEPMELDDSEDEDEAMSDDEELD